MGSYASADSASSGFDGNAVVRYNITGGSSASLGILLGDGSHDGPASDISADGYPCQFDPVFSEASYKFAPNPDPVFSDASVPDPERSAVTCIAAADMETEECEMSHAGIIFSGDRILGFADERSSVMKDGRLQEDGRRKTVHKVFSNEKFVITFTGGNSFVKKTENGDRDLYYIEDWIGKHIGGYDSARDLCHGLFRFIYENATEPFTDVSITAGHFSGDIGICTLATVGYDSFSLKYETVRGLHLYQNGNRLFQDILLENTEIWDTGNAEVLKANLEDMYRKADALFDGGYDPVGGPWDVIEIRR